MKTSIIRQRVADFLKQYAPFDLLPESDLLELAGSGKVKFHESEEYLFRSGDPKGQFVWMIQQGRVDLLDESSSVERLLDVLGVGDLLGIEPFAGDGFSHAGARTATDVILYGFSMELFEALSKQHSCVRRFLTAYSSISGKLRANKTSWLDADAPPIEYLRSRLLVLPQNVSARNAASRLMDASKSVAAFVNESGCLIGTVTALELLVVSSERKCPPTIGPLLNTRSIVRKMLHSRGDQVAITSDGTAETPLEAILTSTELALFCGHDPASLIRAIRQAGSMIEISPLLGQAQRLMREGLAQPRDVDDCCRIGFEVVSALAQACIRLAGDGVRAAGIGVPGVSYCWVMFGASARGDAMGFEFPTIAAVYDDLQGNFTSEDGIYFAALAGETVARFHALDLPRIGLDWPEGARPSMPLSQWKRLYSETIQNPAGHDLYARRSFFDMSLLCGDGSILAALEDHIQQELTNQEMAIPLLANDTLANLPPMTFFQGAVLESDGTQRDSFDIAEAVISPIASGARVFALAKSRLAPSNTLARLEAAEIDFPGSAKIFSQAADAYRIGIYYQTLAGCDRIEAGNWGKFDQRLLKTAFSSIQVFLEFTMSTFVPSV